jgi:ABC-type transport system involved in cytochrome bd biosynthesis fused ATPase/permease subunit
VLAGVEWVVPRGVLAGVEGISGAGKTTLLRLVSGRLVPTAGSLICSAERVAWVNQRPYLFQASIAENLLIASPNADDEMLWEVLRSVGLADMVAAMPGGLLAPLGWNGAGVSGGQANRLALARALLSESDTILLDEPTAHLDPFAECEVLDAIELLVPARTIIVASHSPEVLGRCSQVLHLGEEHSLELVGVS